MNNYFKNETLFINEFKNRLEKRYIVELQDASTRQIYNVLGEMVGEEISKDWMSTKKQLAGSNAKEVYYFSMEFLMGRLINNNIMNLGLKSIMIRLSSSSPQ